MRSLLFAVLMSLVLLSSAFAQSTFFDKGEYGYGVMGGILTSEGADGWQASLSGTSLGVLDFNVGFARAEESNIFSFGIAYYLYRPRQSANPIAISLGASVQLGEVAVYSWSSYDDYGSFSTSKENSHLVVINLVVHRTLAEYEGAQLELEAGAGFSKLYFGNADKDIEPVLSLGLPMAFGDRDGTRFVISPTLNSIRYRGNYENTFGFAVGALFGSSYK
jgi:hypothetical protein